MNRRFEDRLEDRLECALDAVFTIILWLGVLSLGALIGSQTFLWWVR